VLEKNRRAAAAKEEEEEEVIEAVENSVTAGGRQALLKL
jgi:hypothetical protein